MATTNQGGHSPYIASKSWRSLQLMTLVRETSLISCSSCIRFWPNPCRSFTTCLSSCHTARCFHLIVFICPPSYHAPAQPVLVIVLLSFLLLPPSHPPTNHISLTRSHSHTHTHSLSLSHTLSLALSTPLLCSPPLTIFY